jgi:hypothetical protein
LNPTAADPAYHEDGFTVIRGLLGPDVVSLLAEYSSILRATGRFELDHQVPGSLRRYGAPAFEAVLQTAALPLSEVAGHRLRPTYSFARVYLHGQELVPHRDRPECEHSATIHLSASEQREWPISLRRGDGPTHAVSLNPGDALLYRGDKLLHWRGPLPIAWYTQLFLHYVDQDGPLSDRALDGRSTLGAAQVP